MRWIRGISGLTDECAYSLILALLMLYQGKGAFRFVTLLVVAICTVTAMKVLPLEIGSVCICLHTTSPYRIISNHFFFANARHWFNCMIAWLMSAPPLEAERGSAMLLAILSAIVIVDAIVYCHVLAEIPWQWASIKECGVGLSAMLLAANTLLALSGSTQPVTTAGMACKRSVAFIGMKLAIVQLLGQNVGFCGHVSGIVTGFISYPVLPYVERALHSSRCGPIVARADQWMARQKDRLFCLCIALLVVGFVHNCHGVTLRYETKLTLPSFVIMSDADGASSDTFYNAGSLDQWLVSCPKTTHHIELNATSFLGEDDMLTVVPILDELPYPAGSTPLSGYGCSSLTIAANKTLLQLQGRSGGPGFTLHYTCIGDYPRPPAPGSPFVCGSTQTKPNGTLMSDRDGSGYSYDTPAGTTVEWVLECPQGYDSINIAVDGYLSGSAIVAWRGYASFVPLTGRVSSRFVADAASAVISLSAASSLCRGITLRYECTLLWNGSSSVVPMKLTLPSGIIMSDADGASSDTFYNAGSLDQWLVSCPKTTHHIELNATSFLGVDDMLTVVPILDELPYPAGFTTLSGYGCSSLTIAANKTLLQLQGRSGGAGFTLHYTCIGDYPRPPAPGPLVCGSTQTKPNGTLMSDCDGSDDSYDTPARTAMEWVLECPQGYDSINIAVDGYLSGSAIVAWRGYASFVPLTGRVSSHFVADAASAVISLSTASSLCRGITLRYECTVWNGSSSVVPMKLTLPSGIIMSDADGASSDTFYNAGSLDQWLVSCPKTTHHIELNATSFLGVGDKLTVVPILDELPYPADITPFPRYGCSSLSIAANKTLLQLQGTQWWSRLHPALHVHRRLPRQPPVRFVTFFWQQSRCFW